MKKKLLPWVIALSALSVSVSAAFYSVSGLGKMFAGASMEVMILAGSLEFAKLVTASLLYEYWKKLNLGLKIYLSFATLVLIIITSAGIYGFLSSAYQETSFKVQSQDKNIEILDKNIAVVEREIKNYESQAKSKGDRVIQLTGIRSNLQSTQDVLIEKSRSTVGVRQQIRDIDSEIKRLDSEINVLNDSISSKNTKISLIEQQKLEVSSDKDLAGEVGPLKYIAELTGASMDRVVNWYIIVLMFVFDPLAIALVVAANFGFSMIEKKEEEENKEKKEMLKKDGVLNRMWKKINSIGKKEEKIDEVKEEIVKEEDVPTQIYPDTNEITEDIETDKKIELEEVLIEDKEETKETEESEAQNTEDVSTVEELPENLIQEEVDNNEEIEDKYNDQSDLEAQKMLRERFRGTPDFLASRKSFRNNPGGEENPLTLK